MNRITREKIKKQREKSGFVGFKTGGKAGTTRGGLFSNLFKRKKMQAPTPSGVTQKKTTTTKPSGTKTTTTKTTTKSGGRAEQISANAAGNKKSTSKATDAEVKAWKARKPNSMKPETWKGYRNVGAALNAWRKEDPRKK